MADEGQVLGVLTVLDHNVVDNMAKGVVIAKGGAWKRRARMKGICSGVEVGTGKENASSEQNIAGKKGFCLRDEELAEEHGDLSGKKPKLLTDVLIFDDAMVEVASQNWPQFDQ